MSDEKPISPFKPNILGQAPVTDKINFSVTDLSGNKYIVKGKFYFPN